MNTIGKILVILNFLFAVAVGALMVIVFATRVKWQEAYNAQKNETIVIKASRDTAHLSAASMANALKAKELENEQLKQKLKDRETESQTGNDLYKLKVDEYANKLKDS